MTTGQTSGTSGILGDAHARAKQRVERRGRRVRPLRQRWLALVTAVLLVAPLLGLAPAGAANADPVAPKPASGESPAAASGALRQPVGPGEMHAIGKAPGGPQVFPALSPGQVFPALSPGEAQNESHGVYAGSENDTPAPGVAASVGQELEHKWDWSHPLPQGNHLMDVDFVDADTGWAVGFMGTILHTTDGGANWVIQSQGGAPGVPPGSVSPDVRFDAVEFVDADTGWVAGGEGGAFMIDRPASTSQGVILRTDDGGETWTPQEFDAPGGFGKVNDIHFIDENNGWAVGKCCDVNGPSNFSDSLLLRTTNGGRDWENLSGAPGLFGSEGEYIGYQEVFFIDEQRGWLTAPFLGGLVYRTDDGGETWTNVTAGGLALSSCVPTAMFFTSATDGYVVACTNSGTANVVWRTTTGGTTWTSHIAPTDGASLHDLEFLDADNGFAVGWRTGYATGSAVLVHTTDAGETWSVRSQFEQAWGQALSFADDNKTATVVGFLGGIMRSEDAGVSWMQQLQHVTLAPLLGVSFADANTGLAVGPPDDLGGDPDVPVILRSTDGARSWELLDPGIPGRGLNDISMIDANIATAVGVKTVVSQTCDREGVPWNITHITPLILRTTDRGESWSDQSPKTDPDPCARTTIPGLRAVSFVDADRGWALGVDQEVGNVVVRTTDGGATWTKQDSDGLPRQQLRDIFFVDADRGWVVGGLGFGSGYPAEIFRTTDGGETWEDVSPAGIDDGLNAVEFVDSERGWAVGEGHVLHTTDGGETWTTQADGSRVRFLNDVSFADANTGTVVGTNGLILRTTDGGASWIEESGPFTGAPTRTNLCCRAVAMIDAEVAVAVGATDFVGLSGYRGGGIIRRRPADIDPTVSPSPTPTVEPTPSPTPTQLPAERGTYPTTPDDPFFGPGEDIDPLGATRYGTQWGPQTIHAPEAWQEDRSTGSAVTVAVLDTGVDLGHYDLRCAGKLDVVSGSDVVSHDSNPSDEFGHGTHVAGIIGACTNNGVGIAGVAPDATIMPIRVLNADGEGTDQNLIDGINRATEAGADIINLSLGYGHVSGLDVFDFTAIDDAIANAAAQGVVIVAAAGNDSFPLCEYPALAEQIICVGASDSRDNKSWYSTFANKTRGGLAVVAPGGAGTVFCDLDSEEILSLYARGIDEDEGDCDGRSGYADLAGTSMAAPHVAGVAALVYDRLGGERSPENAQQVIDALTSTAVDLGPPGFDPAYGSGRVDALAAVCAVGPDCDEVDPTPTPTETTTASPSPTESGSPSPSPSDSPQPGASDVSFTGDSAQSGQYSDETLFKARLADSNGDALGGRELIFKLVGDGARTFNATTNDDGVASVTPTLEEKPGPHQLTVRFAGDEDHSSDADTMSFVVDKEDSALDLTETKGKDKALVARLSDGDTPADGVAGRTIDFYAGAELIGSATTDDDGVASFEPPKQKGRNEPYEAVFEGDEFYLGSSAQEKSKGGKGGGGGGGNGGRESSTTYGGKVLLM